MNKYKSFVALRPCGCLVMAAVDDPAHAKDTAKEVAAAIREGYRVRIVEYGEMHRYARFDCDVCRPPKPAKPPSAQQEMAL